MSNVSKQIYRKLNSLFPDLQKIEPFSKVELNKRGKPLITLVMLESNPAHFNFILTRYINEDGQLIANPSIEILANPDKKIANVATYKDPDYFHSAMDDPKEIGTIALSRANRYLYDLLKDIKNWKRLKSDSNFLGLGI